MIPDEIIPGTGYDGLYDCGDNTSMYVFEGTDLSFFDRICGNVTASGYSLLCESDIEGNISRTYRGDNLIHIYLTPSDKKTRLISDSFSDDLPAQAEKSGDTPPSFIQFEVLGQR